VDRAPLLQHHMVAEEMGENWIGENRTGQN
jgi:hypothetical protein